MLVDPERRIARVGPGATWDAVIGAAARFGLAPVSGTNASVGVTGFTFGGGHGFSRASMASAPTTRSAPARDR